MARPTFFDVISKNLVRPIEFQEKPTAGRSEESVER